MTLTVTPLEAPIGAEIHGLDPSRPVSDGDFRILERTMLDHGAFVAADLFGNDRPENVDWLLDLGRRFGPLVPHILDQYHHPRSPEMTIIAKNRDTPQSRSTAKPAGAFWHSDLSYKAEPSDAIFLYATHVPSTGGDTMVANMAMAYDALPEATKRRIAGRGAIHSFEFAGTEAIPKLTATQAKKVPDVVHPVVRVHPRTGRKILYISPGYTMRIVDMDRAESDALLKELFAHALDPRFQYRHSWRRGMLLGLDNRATMHCAVDDYTEPRQMLRMIVGCTELPLKAA